jgi:hypothetical protein
LRFCPSLGSCNFDILLIFGDPSTVTDPRLDSVEEGEETSDDVSSKEGPAMSDSSDIFVKFEVTDCSAMFVYFVLGGVNVTHDFPFPHKRRQSFR